jgi:hypothetical protein
MILRINSSFFVKRVNKFIFLLEMQLVHCEAEIYFFKHSSGDIHASGVRTLLSLLAGETGKYHRRIWSQ